VTPQRVKAPSLPKVVDVNPKEGPVATSGPNGFTTKEPPPRPLARMGPEVDPTKVTPWKSSPPPEVRALNSGEAASVAGSWEGVSWPALSNPAQNWRPPRSGARRNNCS